MRLVFFWDSIISRRVPAEEEPTAAPLCNMFTPGKDRGRDSVSVMGSEVPDLGTFLIRPYQARGLLSKLSSKGQWQKRLYELRGPYLCYWSSESAQKVDRNGHVSMPDAATDLRTMQSVEWNVEAQQLILTSKEGADIRLKAPTKKEEASMPQWRQAMQAAVEHLSPRTTSRKSIAPDHISPPLPPEPPTPPPLPQKPSQIGQSLAAAAANAATTEKEKEKKKKKKNKKKGADQEEEEEEEERNKEEEDPSMLTLLQGPLEKKGGGTSMFGRRNWKTRYFVLCEQFLQYYESERAAQNNPTEPLGTVYFGDGGGISPNGVRESAFSAPLRIENRAVGERGIVPTLLLSSKGGRVFEMRALDAPSHASWERKLREVLGMPAS